MNDIRQDSGFLQQLTAAFGLSQALLVEVDIDPTGEEVLGIPFAFAVAKQDQGVRSLACGHVPILPAGLGLLLIGMFKEVAPRFEIEGWLASGDAPVPFALHGT